MTDGQAAETPPGTPSRRALGAIESAVRRAQAAQGGVPPSPIPPSPARDSQWRPPVAAAGGRGPEQDPARRRTERWLLTSVVAAAVLVVAAATALAVSLSGTHQPAAPASTAAGVHSGAAPHSGVTPGKDGGSAGTSGPPTTTSSSPASVSAGGPPVISALNPSSGSVGEGIQVAGANFLSSNGQILATFNGQVAPTSCPAQNTCTVTVPPSSGSSTAQVTITTPSGTSNAMTFRYS